MKVTAIIVLIYGVLIAFGGIMGYIKGGSEASLIFGGTFGLALLFSSYFLFKGKSAAQYIALGLTFCLDGLFTYRFAKTAHFFPSGFFSLVSLAIFIIIALRIRRTSRNLSH